MSRRTAVRYLLDVQLQSVHRQTPCVEPMSIATRTWACQIYRLSCLGVLGRLPPEPGGLCICKEGCLLLLTLCQSN